LRYATPEEVLQAHREKQKPRREDAEESKSK
jgi:hypothetical protein